MREIDPNYDKLVLVCVNDRCDGRECCAQKNSMELYKELKARLKEVDLRIRTSRTGCLGQCNSGATVVIQPKNIWLGDVTTEDIPELINLICKPGR